jgi:hypothetical protein
MADTSSNNYVLGRGRIYFNRFVSDSDKSSVGGEIYFGNTTEFATTVASDTLDHFGSEGGLKVKDASVTLQINRSGKFTTDNISATNLALFFSGVSSTVTTTAAPAATENMKLYKGAYHQLGTTGTNPAGLRKITNLVVTTIGGGPVTISPSEYTFDSNLGRLFINSDAATVISGTAYKLTYDVAASTREQILSKNDSIYGAIRFVADNGAGKNRDFFLPMVKLASDGDYNLKGDDWQTMGFNMEILKLNDATEALYIDGRPV